MGSILPVAPAWFRFTVVDERTTLMDDYLRSAPC